MKKKFPVSRLVEVGVLAGAVVGLLVWRHSVIRGRELGLDGSGPTVVANVAPGGIVVDGASGEWEAVGASRLDKPIEGMSEGGPWKQIRLAHDGTNLYILLTLNERVEDLCRKNPKGLIGEISLDADNNSATGLPPGPGEGMSGADRSIRLMARPDDEGRPGVAVFVQQFGPDGSPTKVQDTDKTSHSAPDSINFSGGNIEMAVPLLALDLRQGKKATFFIYPLGAPVARTITLRMK